MKRFKGYDKEKLPCPYCGKLICGGSYLIRHKEICADRIYKCPIDELTYGEAKDSDRFDEWVKNAREVE
jgi:hypothetical protein